MILLSLEDPQDGILCDGGKRVRICTHPREHLTDTSIQGNGIRSGARTVAVGPGSVSVLGDICIGITKKFW